MSKKKKNTKVSRFSIFLHKNVILTKINRKQKSEYFNISTNDLISDK